MNRKVGQKYLMYFKKKKKKTTQKNRSSSPVGVGGALSNERLANWHLSEDGDVEVK